VCLLDHGACLLDYGMHNGIESLSAKEIEIKIVGGASGTLVSMMTGELNWISMINRSTMVLLDLPFTISLPNNRSSLVQSINSK